MTVSDILLLLIFGILFFLVAFAGGCLRGFEVGYFKAMDEIGEALEEVDDNE